jgi:hypothetical protein
MVTPALAIDPSPAGSEAKSSAQAFLAEIEDFLRGARISPSGFGRAALGDPNFVRDLRGGRAPSLRLVDRVRAFMATRTGAEA